eukprot:CAMPEP_0168745016 /NCGR_PEP_ID=MMETSP0724-20121128/14393_1 /TAXON_ID=265536 /ORGANISM="Amphiprora sp., Strain CCMP467" /LENGTH=172 /DNA_ID=CAMNT_0008792701 /DNA_START=77 /DNA_END=595 /DNA_ORIENTATION=-
MRNHIPASEIPPLPEGVSEELYELRGRKCQATFWFVFNALSFLFLLIYPIVWAVVKSDASYFWFYGLAFGCNMNSAFQALNTTVAVKRVKDAFVIVSFKGTECTYTFNKYESIAIEEGSVVFTLADDWYQQCRKSFGCCACFVCKVYKRPMDGPTLAAFRKTNGLGDEEEKV